MRSERDNDLNEYFLQYARIILGSMYLEAVSIVMLPHLLVSGPSTVSHVMLDSILKREVGAKWLFLILSGSSNSGAILGGVIAAIVITGVVAAVGFMLYKRRKGKWLFPFTLQFNLFMFFLLSMIFCPAPIPQSKKNHKVQTVILHMWVNVLWTTVWKLVWKQCYGLEDKTRCL